MSLRMPQGLGTEPWSSTGPSALDREIAGEKAAFLGRAGRLVQHRLEKLRNSKPDDTNRVALVELAAKAVHSYFVQRELCGLLNHDRPTEDYAIPTEVLARLGAV